MTCCCKTGVCVWLGGGGLSQHLSPIPCLRHSATVVCQNLTVMLHGCFHTETQILLCAIHQSAVPTFNQCKTPCTSSRPCSYPSSPSSRWVPILLFSVSPATRAQRFLILSQSSPKYVCLLTGYCLQEGFDELEYKIGMAAHDASTENGTTPMDTSKIRLDQAGVKSLLSRFGAAASSENLIAIMNEAAPREQVCGQNR